MPGIRRSSSPLQATLSKLLLLTYCVLRSTYISVISQSWSYVFKNLRTLKIDLRRLRDGKQGNIVASVRHMFSLTSKLVLL